MYRPWATIASMIGASASIKQYRHDATLLNRVRKQANHSNALIADWSPQLSDEFYHGTLCDS
jgi:hypothetical protein